MIRFLILRVLVPLIILLFARSILRSLIAAFRVAQQRTGTAPPRNIPAAAELKKDPVCGTYVSAAGSLTRTVNGKVLHFCSEECRNKYHAA
jgi:YHS domain-containing protein